GVADVGGLARGDAEAGEAELERVGGGFAALGVVAADDVVEAMGDAVVLELALDARARAARDDAGHDPERGEGVEQLVDAVQQLARLVGEVGEPALVRVRPPLARQADGDERVVPVGRVRPPILLAVERDAEIGERLDVGAVARLRGVSERAVPIEQDGTHGTRYQISLRPNWICRGSPAPLCTVPSKLKTRFVTSGRWKFLALKTLNTSMAGSMVMPDTGRPFATRKSSEEN